jgi:hypothetical protein
LEGLSFVSAVTITEYPDPSVPVPGMIRVDIALTEDNDFNRRVADQRINELRPAGIYIDRQWAGRVVIGFHVDLVLAGSSLPTSQVRDIKDGITTRLRTYVNNLGPNATLRRTRVVALVLQDDNIVDATISISADGTSVNEETWTLPTGKTAGLDSAAPVTFGTVQFEEAAIDGQFVLVQVDADIKVTNLSVSADSLKASLTSALEGLLIPLQPGATITFDQIATAIRNDTQFAMVRNESVVVFDQEGGGFTELRDNDPAFTLPPNSTLVVRAVRVEESAQ